MAPKNRLQRNTDASEQGNEDLDKKRLRNRLAQRAFRRRQAGRLRELLDRTNSSDKPYDEIVRNLQEENSCLQRSLIEVQSNLARLIATMQTLSGTVLTALGESPRNEPLGNLNIYQGDPVPTVASDLPGDSGKTLMLASRDHFQSEHGTTEAAPEPEGEGAILTQSQANASFETNTTGGFSSLAQQIPNIWTFEYQTGLEPFVAALTGSEDSSIILGGSWPKTNSPFSDHIYVLQQLLKGKVERIMPLTGPSITFFYQEVAMVLSLFNSMTRPDVMRWYAKTRFYHIIHLTAWQIYPCTTTFNAIHPQYQPTAIQLQHSYPRVIDWIPFPSIRDRLIQLHAANPQIDQIFCDAVSSYVVEAWMSDLVIGAPAIKAYVRVTDLVANIDLTEPASNNDSAAALPAPDVATLFPSSECSWAVFNQLGMNSGVSNYKIDPAFFGSYPELYDHNAEIAATGMPLRPDIQTRLTPKAY